MVKRRLFFFLSNLTVFIFASSSFATLLPFTSPLPKVSQPYDTILLRTWEGIKRRNIDPYSVPLVHRPKSEMPNDAVSEGVGYGLLCAIYCNDRVYFNKIWDASETSMWSGEFYNWRVDQNGAVIGSGPASDAEEDIALALIFADQLVKSRTWTSHTSPKGATYAVRAQSMIAAIWSKLVEEGKYLRSGDNWGGKAFVNPGYFAPAFYRVFDAYETTPHDWTGLIDQCYASIALSPGFSLGLVPDWMTPGGAYAESALGYNSYGGGHYLYKDGIRVFWRIATDYLWYGEPRAKTFLDKAYAFIKTPERSNFFQMDGAAVPDTFSLGNKAVRNRTEHSHLTIGMWACAAMGSGGATAADTFSGELLNFYTPGADYFGKATDPSGEDTLHNEMYFDQFLAWFGASLISGVFTNLWEDLNDPNPNLPLDWTIAPAITPEDVDANTAPLRIYGLLNKPARWSVQIINRDSASWTAQFSGVSDTVRAAWYGFNSQSQAMPFGFYNVTVTAKGLTPVVKTVWLGRALDLKVKNRLLVDDFRDGDLTPFFGTKWTGYLDSYDGRNGSSAVTTFVVAGSDTASYLRWSFKLSGGQALGFNPFAALEWNCETSGGNLNLTGLDTVIVTIRSATPLKVSTQLITTDITDFNYFEDSLSLTTQWQELRLPITIFRHRFNYGSATVDLSKLKAIRFQAQYPDNTVNELQVKRMLFAGRLDALYKSPPPYVPHTIGVRSGKPIRSTDSFRLRPANGRLLITFPQRYGNAAIVISDVKGREIRRLNLSRSAGAWDYRDKNGKLVGAGIYLGAIKWADGEMRFKIPKVNGGR